MWKYSPEYYPGTEVTNCPFNILTAHLKRSNPFKTLIPVYISIKYRYFLLSIICILCLYFFIIYYLYFMFVLFYYLLSVFYVCTYIFYTYIYCYVAIGEHWRRLFCSQVNISENCVFIFSLDFNFFQLSQKHRFWLTSLDLTEGFL